MSKRLKKRIQELCGLLNLKREERLRRANEILNSTELKQAICNQILGTTFKDVEKTMVGIINERKLTEEQQEQLELEKTNPEKFDVEFEFKLNKSVSDKVAAKADFPKYREYTMSEVVALLEASKAGAPIVEPELRQPAQYEYMSRELAEQLVNEHYEYLEKEKERKRLQWDSSKTIELDIRIASTMRPSKPTKD